MLLIARNRHNDQLVAHQPGQLRIPQRNTDGTPVLSGRTETYGYDEINRLTSVAYGDGSIQEYPFWTGRVHLRTRA
jgi:hypothetical protein